MALPSPDPRSSPDFELSAVVSLPVWLWVQAESLEPVSATAEVSAGSVTVVATPGHTDWDMGDGRSVRCAGNGTPYAPGVHDPDSESPDCGHTYRTSSRNEPDHRFRVTVTADWSVEWRTSDGEGGELDPLSTSAVRSLRVDEVHALVNDD